MVKIKQTPIRSWDSNQLSFLKYLNFWQSYGHSDFFGLKFVYWTGSRGVNARSHAENFERLWLIRVEVVEVIMHHKLILGAYDNWICLVPLNTFYVGTPNVRMYIIK